MSFTYDPTTELGQVRQVIGDTVEASQIFSDAEIQSALLFRGTVARASAQLLNAMANNVAWVLKDATVQEITTRGSQTSKALREAARQILEDESAAPAYAVAEYADSPYTRWERLVRQAWRGVY